MEFLTPSAGGDLLLNLAMGSAILFWMWKSGK